MFSALESVINIDIVRNTTVLSEINATTYLKCDFYNALKDGIRKQLKLSRSRVEFIVSNVYYIK